MEKFPSYLQNLLVIRKSFKDHLNNCKEVLTRIQKNPTKAEFKEVVSIPDVGTVFGLFQLYVQLQLVVYAVRMK